MSPDNDQNPQPSTMEAAPSETVVENPAVTIGLPDGHGAAAAVAPAREHPRAAEPLAQTNSAETAPQAAEAAPATAEAEETHTLETPEALETMDQLLDQFSAPAPVAAEGEIFDGRVLAVTDAGVIVDVGGKFEGLVPAQEFLDSGGAIEFGEGQTIEVERLHEQKDGYVLLSHIRAHRRRVWERIEKAYREHANVTGKATERIKGGLVVDVGVRAFLPASQIELRPVHDLEGWKDRAIEVRVLKLNRKRGNVVVSRRAILEDEQKAKRDALADTLAEGAVVTGHVK